MKKIGIDARLINQTGVGTYVSNLLFYLQEIIPKDIIVNVYMLEEDIEKVNLKNKNFSKKIAQYHWHSFAEQFGFLKTLNQDKLDLMHFTYFSYPILYRRPFISTIHDLTPFIFKTGKASTKGQLVYETKHFFFRTVIRSQMKRARLIITPTKTVKKQLVDKFGIQYKDKIVTIPEGVNRELLAAKENSVLKKSFPENFFIYIGNFYPHKNVENLIEAFSQVKSRVSLILVGPDDFFAKRLYRLIDKLKQGTRIIFYHNPTKSDLVFFYKNAQALIHPSLSEGFGLPLIEAANFSLPIIASNISVFKEVLDGSYISFDPMNIEDIKKKIDGFLMSKQKFDYGKILKKYSFEKMAKETLKIYEAVLA